MMRFLVALALAASLIGCSSGEETRRDSGVPATSYTTQSAEYSILGNRNSGKFHYPSCKWAQKISVANRVGYASADAARAAGMKACKVCRP
ncbi:hypothetical protein D3C87_1411710 [compost metagenome]